MARDRTHENDPSRTKTIQQEYAQKIRGRFSDINTEIRAGVRDRDVFGLQEEQLADFDPDNLRDYTYDTTAQKERQFMNWLEEQMNNGVLEVIDERDNTYVRRSYERGIKNAHSNLRDAGVDIEESDVARLINQPVHQDRLETLYARNFQALEGITAATSRETSRVLTDALSEGVNPRVAARRLTDRVDSIGKTRATTMARTEIMRSHNYGSIQRYRGVLGEDAEVEVQAEVMTAQDDRVCDQCTPMHGVTMSLDEAESSGPPFHPVCRCVLRPTYSN